MADWLYSADARVVYAATVALLVAAVEVGALLGRRGRARGEAEKTLAGMSMGLLALMIGFTFAMALARFDARKEAVVEEANAIGTTALRARMLPAPVAAEAGALLKEYAGLRATGRGFRLNSPEGARKLRRTAEIQEALWAEAMRAARVNPGVVPTGLFIQSLNEMIDMHGRRLAAARNRVPAVVFLMLAGIAVVALGFSGYGTARDGYYPRAAMALMAVMIASVIMLVFDLDNPQAGTITVSQQPLIDAIEGMR